MQDSVSFIAVVSNVWYRVQRKLTIYWQRKRDLVYSEKSVEQGLFPVGFIVSSVYLKHAVFCNGRLKVSKR